MMKELRVISIGTTPMTRKVNNLLERMECVELIGVVNMIPERFYSRSNFDPLFDFKSRRPSDIYYTDDINNKDTIEWIRNRKPDLIIQSGWSQIWKKEVLSIPSLFCLGIHAAPLPEGRGAAILNWKLIEGGGKWGNSLFIMEEKTDTGDILDFEPFELEERDDIRTAYLKADRTALKMLERTLPKILDGSFRRISQAGKKGSRYYRRTPKDGKMEFSWSAEKIHNYVRALTHPYPGAFFETNFGKVVVWTSEIGEPRSEGIAGEILEIKKGKGILLQAGNGTTIWLKSIEPENDAEVWADVWAKEISLIIGDNIWKQN
ncbi:MAG: methionyl-tRNA formyltransferase [Melioribacter sp.]|uniref:methionyl-tRNA formyltransferase n=1 Tax=Melioribacter sp. TaxID=2052167 RepID=UPI003BBB289C